VERILSIERMQSSMRGGQVEKIKLREEAPV